MSLVIRNCEVFEIMRDFVSRNLAYTPLLLANQVAEFFFLW